MNGISSVMKRGAEGGSTWLMNVESFDWNPGVFLAGAAEAYKKTGDKSILEYLISWTERHIGEAYSRLTINSTAPLIMILELYRQTGNEEYLKVCSDIAERIITSAPLTVDGGLEHTVTEDAQFSDQMWADTLFMAVLFLARYGRLTGREEYISFAQEQLLLHHRLLKDKSTGLFFHGWNGAERTHMSGALWARANAWIILASGLILSELPREWSGREEIVISLNAQARALSKCQNSGGGFCTVLDRCESYAEASATAGIAAGIFYGIRTGIFGDEYMETAQKAAVFVKEQIMPDGSVDNVSGGTPVLASVEDYFKVSLGSALYGQGLALFMLSFE